MVSARTGIAVLFLSALAACDDAGDVAAKALDANNNQPGEADARVVEVGTVATRTAAVAADDKEYVVVAANGDVFHRPLASGAFEKLSTTGRSTEDFESPRLLLDANWVWYYDRVGIVRIPRAGGAPEDMNVGALEDIGFVQNATSLFVVASDNKTVKSVDKTSKAVTTLPGTFQYLARIIDAGNGELLIADRDASTVILAPMTGDGAQKVIAKDQANPQELAANGDYVYWYNGGISDHQDVADRLLRARRDGTGAVETLANFDTEIPHELAADGTFVYARVGGITRIPIAGGTPTRFVNIYAKDYFLAADHITILEDNALAVSQDTKDKPNRVVTVTK